MCFCCENRLAVNASHTFYNAVTMTSGERNCIGSQKQKTKMLCQTTDPEEKRKIVGDTFMNVCQMALVSTSLNYRSLSVVYQVHQQ